MTTKKLKPQNLMELANDWGIDYQVFLIKSQLIDSLKTYCHKNSISQRELARRVPGLSQDRVSKIFSGQVGHMTIDKLIEIMSSLGMKITIKTGSAA